MKLKHLLFLVLFNPLTFLGQSDELLSNIVIAYDSVEYDFNGSKWLYIHKRTKKPINGWVVISDKKYFNARFFKEGRRHSYSVNYRLEKGRYKLFRTDYFNEGVIKYFAFFNPKKIYLTDSSASFGLKEFYVFNDSMSSNIRSYKVSLAKKKTWAQYYYPETHHTYKLRIKSCDAQNEVYKHVWNLGQSVFPPILNSNKDFLSNLKFDGVYYSDTNYCCENRDTAIFSIIRIEPNYQIVYQEYHLQHLVEGAKPILVKELRSMLPKVNNKVLPNKIEMFSNENIKSIVFKPSGMLLEFKAYKGGPTKRYWYSFRSI